ncbi:MAG: hypothetical protein GSR73_04940 [Desulfurococcales archaeon]|nr:hypothetical protein [Desulfurococcales archaeon]
MKRYRCRHDIVASILEGVRDGASRISRIARAANLPLDRARALVEDLVEHGLLIYDHVSREYSLTDLAYEWLALYEKLREVYDVSRV